MFGCSRSVAYWPRLFAFGVRSSLGCLVEAYNRLTYPTGTPKANNRLTFNRLTFNQLTFNRLTYPTGTPKANNRLTFNRLTYPTGTPKANNRLTFNNRMPELDSNQPATENLHNTAQTLLKFPSCFLPDNWDCVGCRHFPLTQAQTR
ncbi:MAG: hypothetical protein F6K55_22000 [Moorea sp. SIO4A3]|nr:hypothetical protein [Moorena sp. SIO4A3]